MLEANVAKESSSDSSTDGRGHEELIVDLLNEKVETVGVYRDELKANNAVQGVGSLLRTDTTESKNRRVEKPVELEHDKTVNFFPVKDDQTGRSDSTGIKSESIDTVSPVPFTTSDEVHSASTSRSSSSGSTRPHGITTSRRGGRARSPSHRSLYHASSSKSSLQMGTDIDTQDARGNSTSILPDDMEISLAAAVAADAAVETLNKAKSTSRKYSRLSPYQDHFQDSNMRSSSPAKTTEWPEEQRERVQGFDSNIEGMIRHSDLLNQTRPVTSTKGSVKSERQNADAWDSRITDYPPKERKAKTQSTTFERSEHFVDHSPHFSHTRVQSFEGPFSPSYTTNAEKQIETPPSVSAVTISSVASVHKRDSGSETSPYINMYPVSTRRDSTCNIDLEGLHLPNKSGNIQFQQSPICSFGTPVTSFDERGGPSIHRRLSPNAAHPRSSQPVYLGEHQRSPNFDISPLDKSSVPYDMGSFSFFNNSFDSINESGGHFMGGPEGPSNTSAFPQGGRYTTEPKLENLKPSLHGSDHTRNDTRRVFSSRRLESSHHSRRDEYPHRRDIDISLPPLTHAGSSGSGGSRGTLSPINAFGPVLERVHSITDSRDTLTNRPFKSKPQETFSLHSQEDRAEVFSRPETSISRTYSLDYKPSLSKSTDQYIVSSFDPLRQGDIYSLLKKCRKAFDQCSFILPVLRKNADQEKSSDEVDSIIQYSSSANKQPLCETSDLLLETDSTKAAFMPVPTSVKTRKQKLKDPSDSDVAIAQRRVASAICAFGGSIRQTRRDDSSSSIFRARKDQPKSRSQLKYESQLPDRYYENGSHLSWEVEDKPPVEIVLNSEGKNTDESSRSSNIGHDHSRNRLKGSKKQRVETDSDSPRRSDSRMSQNSGFRTETPVDEPKMKYRCKLCGQPKQNHTCPYRQSLQRSIGVTVHPAVNSFNASEPGKLAPALAQMNNFVSPGSSPSSTPQRRKSLEHRNSRVSKSLVSGFWDPSEKELGKPKGPQVTPDTLRSSLSDDDCDKESWNGKRKASAIQDATFSVESKPQFIETVDIRPEQHRIVNMSSVNDSSDAFSYADLPLPYGQRKRMSDKLFMLSKESSELTDDCAIVLREAREANTWDLGVAEVMTQVLIIKLCKDGDFRLEGLRHYLLTLGIAC